MCRDAGAPGWSNSSTRALSSQIPSTAASTSSVGSIYSASTFQVDDGAQCGGTGGEARALSADTHTRSNTYAAAAHYRVLWHVTLLVVPGLSFIYLRSWGPLNTSFNLLTPLEMGRRTASDTPLAISHLQGSVPPGIAASQLSPASPAPGRSRCAPRAAPPASRSPRSAGHAIRPRSAPQQPQMHRCPH